MNVNDTEIVRAILLNHGGYVESMREEMADIWLTNTCAIRDRAEQKVWQRLRTQRNAKLSLLQQQKQQKQKQNLQPNVVAIHLQQCQLQRILLVG